MTHSQNPAEEHDPQCSRCEGEGTIHDADFSDGDSDQQMRLQEDTTRHCPQCGGTGVVKPPDPHGECVAEIHRLRDELARVNSKLRIASDTILAVDRVLDDKDFASRMNQLDKIREVLKCPTPLSDLDELYEGLAEQYQQLETKLTAERAAHEQTQRELAEAKAEVQHSKASVNFWKATAEMLTSLVGDIYQVTGHIEGGDELESAKALRAERDAARERIAVLEGALKKLRGYNRDIHEGRINYRPLDHIEAIDAALAAEHAEQPAGEP